MASAISESDLSKSEYYFELRAAAAQVATRRTHYLRPAAKGNRCNGGATEEHPTTGRALGERGSVPSGEGIVKVADSRVDVQPRLGISDNNSAAVPGTSESEYHDDLRARAARLSGCS